MKLLIDIGNSRIKWAFARDRELISPDEMSVRDLDDVDTFFARLTEVPTSAYVVNVAGMELEQALREAFRAKFYLELVRIYTTECSGEVKNGYRSFEQLGADRWAAIVAGWERYQRPVCVVDAGTAVTIDLLNGSGQHLGGVIVPGFELMRSALQTDTSDIEQFVKQSDGLQPGSDWYGRETSAAVTQGALRSVTATIARAFSDFVAEYPDGHLLLTGGDAELLAPLLDVSPDIDAALVLNGLNLLSERRDGPS